MASPLDLPDRIARQLPPKAARQLVDLGDVQLHVMTQGEGPTVLLLHGNPTWSFLWRKVFVALEDAPLRLVAPDLVGLGLSTKVPASAHTLEAHATWIRRLLDALGLDAVTFVGQDWGGPIGLRALADTPERMTGLVILNTVTSPPKPDFRPTAFHRFAHRRGLSDIAFRLFGYPQRALHQAQGDPDSIQGDVAYAYRWPLRRLRDRAAPLALARMVPDSLEHPSVPPLRVVHDLVAGFEGPAAIVWGDRDPILGRARTHIERTIPHARVTRTDAGHFLQEEVPDDIARAILHVTGLAGEETP